MGCNIILRKNKKSVVEIHNFLENPLDDNFFSNVSQRIRFDKEIGFAGFKDKETLKESLRWILFGEKTVDKWNTVKVDDCVNEINYVLDKCLTIKSKVRIFIFPTINSFVVKKMNGVSGFTPWKNTILIGTYNTRNWAEALRNTFCHELAHSIHLNFNKRATVADDLVFEGVAEHFREYFLDNKKSPWVTSISKENAQKIFEKIKERIFKNDNLSSELFFGTGEYPLWAGYAIGYYLVGDYLKKMKEIDWYKIMQEPVFTIIKESGWGK